ncbi:unnamed protein product [Orchesella dallaii]|uniref:C2H2-type domain-containing protein n=1 Tax=Orchesella dallaii TaxID=48710 RepID=A0ABP1Q9U7_9HEXA
MCRSPAESLTQISEPEGVTQDELLDKSHQKCTADSTEVSSSMGCKVNESEFFKRKFYNKNELFRKWKGDETTENTVTGQQCVECGIKYGETDRVVCPHKNKLFEGSASVDAETKMDELKCLDCGKIFTKRIHLTLHTKIHAKMGRQKVQPAVEKLKCSFCQLLFNSNHELVIHFREAHYKNYFDSQNNVDSSHETTSTKDLSTWSHCATQVLKEGVDPVTCDKCGQSFSNEDYLKQHKVVHERAPLSCLFCGETFTSNSSLMTHMLIHDEADNATRFGCTRCGRRFGRQNQLNFHVKFCKVKFRDASSTFSTAAKQVNSNSVEIVSMNKRVDQAHENEEQDEKVKQEKEVHRCMDCGREFNRVNYLNSHKKIHFKICNKCTTHIHEKEYEDHVKSCTSADDPIAEIRNPSVQSVSVKKNLPCDICGKLFTCGVELSQHCLSHSFSFETYMDVDSTDFQFMLPLVCEYAKCRRRFSDNADLSNHVMQNHVSHDHLCCEVCGKDFSLESSLLSHRSSAHNLDPARKNQLSIVNVSSLTTDLKVDTSTSQPTFYYMQNGCPPSPNPYVLITQPLKEHADRVFQEMQLSCTFERPEEDAIPKPVVLDRNSTTKSRGVKRREDIPFQNFYICKICGRRFNKNKRNQYINHLWYHNNEGKFGCHLCDRKFCNENLLNEHVQKHSDPNFVSRTRRRLREDVPVQDIYVCEICDKRFPKHKRSQYIHHLFVHKQETQFGCNLCERKFISQNLLNEHLERHSDPTYQMRAPRQSFPIQDIYICEICDQRFPRQKRHKYIHHVWVHKREEQFGCHLCERKFWSANLLDEHVKKHSDPNFVGRVGRRFRADIPIQDLYICEICDRRFTKQRRQQYLQHLSMHRRENQFGCHLCGRKFMSQNLLDDHVKKHSDPNFNSRTYRKDIPVQEVYTCDICERRFPRQKRKQYIHHLWIHQREAKFGCHFCQRKFYSQNTLNMHLSRHKDGTFHARAGPGRAGRKDIPFQDVYSCPKCNNKYTNRHSYLIHLYYHNKQSNQFKCQYCYRIFANRHLLSEHVVKHADPNFSNRPGRGGRQDIPVQDVYYCEECGDGRPYSERQKYILHVRAHELGRKFQCPHCPRHFSNEGNLRYHVEIHKNLKKHQCNDCLKMFKTKDARKSHQEKFCKKVPCKYKCNSCCDRFHSKLILLRHVEKEHPQQKEQETSSDVEYPCQNCSQTFNTTFGLTRHIQVYHPSTAVTFANEVYNSENVGTNGGEMVYGGETAGNAEVFGDDETSTHSDWNPSDHNEDDEFNVTDMLATNFCETELTVEEPGKQPNEQKTRSKFSRGTCQCGVIKKYKSQIFCHNRQCPCVQAGRKCGSKCHCKSSCLNTNDREHEQQQKFKESKEKMLLEQQSEQRDASGSYTEGVMIVPPPVVHIQQTEFSNEINAATSLSYGTLVPSEFISLNGEADASIQQLSLSGYVEGEEDCDPLCDPLQSTIQISTETKTFNSGRTSSINPPTAPASEPGTSKSSMSISTLNSQPNQFLNCQFCGTNKKHFKHVPTYISHMLGHAKEKGGFKCPICKKNSIFNDALSLVRHVVSHNKEISLQCKQCSSKFKSYNDMDKHLRVHHYKPMECGVCSIKFPNSHEMMSHWSQKHPTCQCGVCNLKFFSYEDLTQHMKDIHLPVDCVNCNMRFENVDELITHFTANHNQPQPRPTVSSSSTDSQADRMSFCDALMSFMNCGYCNKKFTNSDDLNEHLSTHLPQQSGNSSNLQCSNEDGEYYPISSNLTCNECGATFNNIDDLTEHLTNHLQQSIYGKYMQPTQEPVSSQSRAQSESNLMEIEIDDNNIEAVEAISCPKCPKTFNNKIHYAQHIKSHNVEICPSCYSIFDSHHDLKEHFQTSLCTVYECDICTRTFSARRNLYQHKTRVHKISGTVVVSEETQGNSGRMSEFQMKTPIIVASTSLAPQQGLNANPQQHFQNSHQQQEIEEIVLE